MNDLIAEGAIIPAKLGVDLYRQQVLDQHGDLPGLVQVRMMADTGAEMSLIDESFAKALGLRWINDQMIVGVSQKPELHRVYAATLHMPIEEPVPRIVQIQITVAGMRENVGRAKFDGLLGRRFLNVFDLLYLGPQDTFSLSTSAFPDE